MRIRWDRHRHRQPRTKRCKEAERFMGGRECDVGICEKFENVENDGVVDLAGRRS